MPTYEYECQACQHRFDIYQSFKDATLKDCPKCSKPELIRLISGGHGFIDLTPKTLGGVADKNAREMRKAGVEVPKSVRRRKKIEDVPFYRSRSDGLPRTDILKDPEKYIETGRV